MVDKVSRPKILYVEDDLNVSALFKTIVEARGFDVVTVETGAECLDLHAAGPFDVVFVDYRLPDMSGLDVCRKILLTDSDASLVMITGKGDQRLVSEALNLGVAQYIQKDNTQVYIELVPSIIDSLLARGKVRRQKRQAEQAKKASDERYQMAADMVKLGHWAWDEINHRMSFCSPGLADIYGVTVEEFLARSSSPDGDYQWYHPDDVVAYQETTRRAKKNKTGFDITCRIVAANGDVRWVHERADVLVDGDGTLIESFGITQDVTDAKLAELEIESRTRELAESEERLRAIITNLPISLTLKDMNENYTLMNPVARHLAGNQPGTAEVEGVLPEDMTAEFNEHDREVIKSGQPVTYEVHVPDNDAPRTFMTTKFPLVDNEGQVYSIGTVGVDITEQQIVAESLEDSQRLAKVGSWRWSRTRGALISFSDEYANILGVSREEALNYVNTTGYDLVHEDDREAFIETFEAAVENGQDYTVEYRVQRPDGEIRNIYEIGEAVRLPNGDCLELRGTLQDVTGQKRIEQEIILARESAETANQAKSEFLSSMSHELRTPLNAVLGFAQMLEYNPKEPLSETQQSSVNQILKGGNHLLKLIDDILDLAKIETGKVSLSIEKVDLRSVIDDCLVLMQDMMDERKLTLSVTGIGGAEITVSANFTRLKQVVINLLSNAIKYNREKGSIHLTVRKLDNGMFRLSLSDTGNGIRKERQHELFKPFSRLDATNSEIEGSGIGLVVCKNLIELMGGEIDFESTSGAGSIFWIDIPSYSGSSVIGELNDATVKTRETPQLDEIEGTMLYVEDNPSNLHLMEVIVSNIDGLIMYSAHSAELGIDIARSKQPDLILLDINLPGMSGLDAIKALRELDETRDIPVLALSAAATKNDVEKGLRAGFQRYLTKPVQVLELTNAIKETLNKRL